MSIKEKVKRRSSVDDGRVKGALLRLNRMGVNIRDHDAVVDALESEIVHYRQVVQVMQDKLRQQTAKMPARHTYYDYVYCNFFDLNSTIQDINESGYRIVSITQDQAGSYTILYEGVVDGEATT